MRTPRENDTAESPITWEDIPLGPGQEPSFRGHFQFTRQGDPVRHTDVRRTPGYESIPVIHRPPHAPA